MILNVSNTHMALMIALVEAMAGMMFLTTPWVSWRVTPYRHTHTHTHTHGATHTALCTRNADTGNGGSDAV